MFLKTKMYNKNFLLDKVKNIIQTHETKTPPNILFLLNNLSEIYVNKKLKEIY